MEKNIKYLGEFKSVQGTSCSHQFLSDDIYRGHKQQNKGTTTMLIQDAKELPWLLIQDAKELPLSLNKYIEEAYNILRIKASEILCFLLSDLDHMYKPELPHSIPVAYGLKGYSLKSEAMRSMMETVLSECKKRGIYIPVCSMDGQWNRLVVRDKENQPLTLCQLQKDVWSKAKSMPKPEIIRNILALQKVNSKHGSSLHVKGLKFGEKSPSLATTPDILQSLKNLPNPSDPEIIDKDNPEIGDLDSVPAIGNFILDILPDNMTNAMDESATESVKNVGKNQCGRQKFAG